MMTEHRRRVHTAMFLGLVALIGLGGWCGARLWVYHWRPDAVFVGNTSVNFGILRPGDVYVHDFVLRNDGNAPLRVIRIATSCGCTKAEPSTRVVPPGGSATIDVEYHARDTAGPEGMYVGVYTNEPGRGFHLIGFHGNIVPDVSVVPASVSFYGKVSALEPQTVVIAADASARIVLKSVAAYDGKVQARAVPNGERGEVAIRITPVVAKLDEGNQSDVVTAEVVVDGDTKSMRIPVHVTLLSDAAATKSLSD